VGTLSWQQERQAQALLDRANKRRGRLSRVRYAARIAGIRRAVLSGAVGNSALGHRLLACRGGREMKLHGSHFLQVNQPKAVRSAIIARRQREAADQFSAPTLPLSPRVRPRSFLEL
jgi:hypothetical protein